MVRTCAKRNSCGHQRRVDSSLSVEQITVTESPFALTELSRHSLVRTNPCAGAWGSSALARNHGKQIGIPPRIAWPSSHRDFELRNSSSSLPAGRQEVTCAPCTYIWPCASGLVMSTRTKPPSPLLNRAMSGIPKRRFSSVKSKTEFILFLPGGNSSQHLQTEGQFPDTS